MQLTKYIEKAEPTAKFIDRCLRSRIWRILGFLIILDGLMILATPNSAVQGSIARFMGFPWFPYIYGSFAVGCGLSGILLKNPLNRQISVFIFYATHTLLLLFFMTIPNILEIANEVSVGTYDGSDVLGLAPLLKYAGLCLVVFLYDSSSLMEAYHNERLNG